MLKILYLNIEKVNFNLSKYRTYRIYQIKHNLNFKEIEKFTFNALVGNKQIYLTYSFNHF